MRLSNTQLAQLRQKPQSTKLNLSIFQPTIIFQAQINNPSAARRDRAIIYDTVSLGDYTAIEADMTMWIGTAPGLGDVGKIRVRSATATTITVSENSDIAWADNLYLTVFRYWELWPIYPHIILDPNNNENVIFYKDYDIAYSNQNSVLGTFVNAGPHRAILLDPASGQGQLYYSSTGSYNLIGSSLSYQWFFEGATVTGSTLADPGYVTYNTPGHYVTRLSISGSNGAYDTTYRYVSVYNAASPPIQKWQLTSMNGSRDEGGYQASFKVYEIIPIQEHAVVVLFGENYYGATKVNIGGNFPNASDIFFVGYVDKDSIHYDYEHSEVTFDATSLTDAMKKSTGFSVSVQSVASPSKWYELLDMDSRRALYHYLRWHTTALRIADFEYTGNDYKVQYFDSDRESMYDAITNYMQNALLGKTVSDRQGKVWMEIDAMAYSNPTGTFIPVMNITRNDWMNTPVIEEQLTNAVSYLEYGGVQFSGVTSGTFTPLIAAAPGSAPGFYGTLENHQGLVLGGQTHLNQILGNVYANKNSQFPNLGLDMSLNASNLDIAPQEAVEVHIAQTDTVRNVTIDGLYIPESMSWKYNPEGLSLLPTMDFRELVNGEPAETVTIPSVNDVGNGFVFDPFSLDFPPLPISFPPTGVTVQGDGAPAKIIMHLSGAGKGLVYTLNGYDSYPNWIQWNAGLTSAQYEAIDIIEVCPNGAIYVACTTSGATGFLARAPSLGSSFTVLEDYTSMTAKMGTTDNVRLSAVGVNRGVSESVLYAISSASDAVKTYLGSGASWTAKATFGGQFTNDAASISYGAGNWLWTCSSALLLGPSADAVVATRALPSIVKCTRHIRVGTGGYTIHWGNTDIALGTNNATSYVEPFTPPIATNAYLDQHIVACSLTGQNVMAAHKTSTVNKSTDYGYSWSVGFPIPGNTKVASTPVETGFLVAGAYFKYTPNMGTIWNDKQGDLINIAAIPIADAIAVVP